jgi:hypothetical protein
VFLVPTRYKSVWCITIRVCVDAVPNDPCSFWLCRYLILAWANNKFRKGFQRRNSLIPYVDLDEVRAQNFFNTFPDDDARKLSELRLRKESLNMLASVHRRNILLQADWSGTLARLSSRGRWESQFVVLRERTLLWWVSEKDALEGLKQKNKMVLRGFIRGLHKSHPAPDAGMCPFTVFGDFEAPHRGKKISDMKTKTIEGVTECCFAGCVFRKEECLQVKRALVLSVCLWKLR